MGNIVTETLELARRAGQECKALRTLINGNAATLAELDTTAKASLVEAINELKAAVDGVEAGATAWGGITGSLASQTDLQAALDAKSDTGHTHDSRYYTEAEIDALLAGISSPTDAEILAAVQSESGRTLATDGTKLDGIEAGATADQSAADIRALGFFDTSNDGTGSGLDADLLDGNHASAFALAGHNHAGTYQPLDADLTALAALSDPAGKLDGIEAGATADQTAGEILTALLTVDGTGSGLDADLVRGTTPSSPGLAGLAASIVTESTTARTLTTADNGKLIVCTNGSATTITVPTSLGAGFHCGIVQAGAGTVTLAASGTTLNKPATLTLAIAEQHAGANLVAYAADTFNVSGQLAAA